MSEMYLKVVWKVGWCAERFLVFKYASMHACKYASMHACKYASMHISKQVCKYAIIQVCNLRGGVTKKNGKIWEKFPIRLDHPCIKGKFPGGGGGGIIGLLLFGEEY